MNPSKVAIVLLVLPGLSIAQVCTEIEDAAERLACYDEQNRVSAEAEQRVPVDEAQTSGPSAASETIIEAGSPEKFGMKKPDDAPKERIKASIVGIVTAGNIDYLQLDNGQVWRETQESRMRFMEGRQVTITEGILNSYDLKMDGYNKIVKVRRVR